MDTPAVEHSWRGGQLRRLCTGWRYSDEFVGRLLRHHLPELLDELDGFDEAVRLGQALADAVAEFVGDLDPNRGRQFVDERVQRQALALDAWRAHRSTQSEQVTADRDDDVKTLSG